MVRKIIDSMSNRALGWILEQHCTVRMTDTALEIVFRGNNRMARELLQDKETARALQEVARTTTGRDISVRIVDTQEPSGEGVTVARQSPEPKNDLASLSEASIVRDALELFGGRILDVQRRVVSRGPTAPPIGEDEVAGMEEQHDE